MDVTLTFLKYDDRITNGYPITYVTSESANQAKAPKYSDNPAKIIITQPPRIKLIKPTQNPLLQMSLLRSDKYAHCALSCCNCHSVAHAFPLAASGPHLPLLLALLAAQYPSHPVATRRLRNPRLGCSRTRVWRCWGLKLKIKGRNDLFRV
jgi:hypothetical protein